MGENWETLGNGVRLLTDRAHRFGEDALLLADFARPRSGERCCDLGTGCGIVAFQWRAQGADNPIDGVELDGGGGGAGKAIRRGLQAGGGSLFTMPTGTDLRACCLPAHMVWRPAIPRIFPREAAG